jgi:hypothetical protein
LKAVVLNEVGPHTVCRRATLLGKLAAQAGDSQNSAQKQLFGELPGSQPIAGSAAV